MSFDSHAACVLHPLTALTLKTPCPWLDWKQLQAVEGAYMDTRSKRSARRIVAALLLAGGIGGCAVYSPPYAAYEPYYSGYSYYGYPTYVAPPVSLNFGFYEHRHRGGYYGKHHGHGWRGHGHGWRGHGHGHGWRGHGGSGYRGGWGHRGGRH